MVVYGLRDVATPSKLAAHGYLPGAFPLLERHSGIPHLHDERSDRSRTMWPYVFDVLHGHGRRWHLDFGSGNDIGPCLGRERHRPLGVEILRFLDGPSDELPGGEAAALERLPGGARGEVTGGLAVFYFPVAVQHLSDFQSRAEQHTHAEVAHALNGIGMVGLDRESDAMHASASPSSSRPRSRSRPKPYRTSPPRRAATPTDAQCWKRSGGGSRSGRTAW